LKNPIKTSSSEGKGKITNNQNQNVFNFWKEKQNDFPERKREDLEKADIDRIAQIDSRNVQKQKPNDIENSMLNRKKKKLMNTEIFTREDTVTL
jgi:hypothetical protein